MSASKEIKSNKKSTQLALDLFHLDPLIDKNHSNLFEVLDASGLYLCDSRVKYFEQATAKDMTIDRYSQYNGIDVHYSITAANIERTANNVTYRVFVFPGIRENTIMDVLKKIATEQRTELYEVEHGEDKGKSLISLTVSLYEIFCRCKAINKQYSYSQIRESMNILNNAFLRIASSGGEISLNSTYLPIMRTIEGGKNTKFFICFHPMVTDVINSLAFRRYNYQIGESFKSDYTKMLYKRLCLRWTQASVTNPYTIKLSTLILSLKTPNKHITRDKELFERVFQELKDKEILEKYEIETRKEGKRIVDCVCSLYATDNFAQQMASNNKAKPKMTLNE